MGAKGGTLYFQLSPLNLQCWVSDTRTVRENGFADVLTGVEDGGLVGDRGFARVEGMLRIICVLMLLGFAPRLRGAELEWDFPLMAGTNWMSSFRSVVGGEGKPGEWKIVADEIVPRSGLPQVTPRKPEKTEVLAQLSRDGTDKHYPMLIYEPEVFRDFKLTMRFKTVAGEKERMAGVVFRYQDERNYYYVRASSLGNTFRWFKVQDGKLSDPIGLPVEIPSGVWHDMSVECKGTEIKCRLNGSEIPALSDPTFYLGKIGLWTKSDSVSHFAEVKITYTPHQSLAQVLVKEIMTKFPNLLGLRLTGQPEKDGPLKVIASSKADDLGWTPDAVTQAVFNRGATFYGRDKERDLVSVTLPLRDRNGDVVAAARIEMKSFLGQTDENILARAVPVRKEMQGKVLAAKDLYE